MSMAVNAGELRTRIVIEDYVEQQNDNGYPQRTWKNVKTDGGSFGCKWVNAHGRDVLQARQLELEELATLTMRYTDKLTPTCRIFRGKDPRPYDVISIDNIREANRYLEVKVHRKVAAV